MAYSIDLREKALNCYKQCNNASKVAKTYGISRNTLYLWIKLEEQTGSLKHQVKGQNATKWDTQALKQYIEQNPDAYLYEMAEMFSCSTSTIFYALKKLGITRKKRPPLTKNKTQKK
ncbi:Transposase [Kingella negevensis]|uniref:Transposase n=1 Tax=Kingella negevensis TaxID=1522312 RepID=A0A238TCM0_9NEIS|nr:Transposase [Kingella negevensis]